MAELFPVSDKKCEYHTAVARAGLPPGDHFVFAKACPCGEVCNAFDILALAADGLGADELEAIRRLRISGRVASLEAPRPLEGVFEFGGLFLAGAHANRRAMHFRVISRDETLLGRLRTIQACDCSCAISILDALHGTPGLDPAAINDPIGCLIAPTWSMLGEGALAVALPITVELPHTLHQSVAKSIGCPIRVSVKADAVIASAAVLPDSHRLCLAGVLTDFLALSEPSLRNLASAVISEKARAWPTPDYCQDRMNAAMAEVAIAKKAKKKAKKAKKKAAKQVAAATGGGKK